MRKPRRLLARGFGAMSGATFGQIGVKRFLCDKPVAPMTHGYQEMTSNKRANAHRLNAELDGNFSSSIHDTLLHYTKYIICAIVCQYNKCAISGGLSPSPLFSLLVLVKAAADAVQELQTVVALAALAASGNVVQDCANLLLGYLLVAVHFAINHIGDIFGGHCAANLAQCCDGVDDGFGCCHVAVGAVDDFEVDGVECVHCVSSFCTALLLMYEV